MSEKNVFDDGNHNRFKPSILPTDCCICRHFRMFKPIPEYCMLKKLQVYPTENTCECFMKRKGLASVDVDGSIDNGEDSQGHKKVHA